jgi:hypothetical protein
MNFRKQQTMETYTYFSTYKHYFRYNKEPTFVQGLSILFISNERGRIQQYESHGKCEADSLPSAAY